MHRQPSPRELQVVPGAADVESEATPQRLGVVRRKPGRGAATLSVACSDKLARWSLLGVQARCADHACCAGVHTLVTLLNLCVLYWT